VKNPPKKEMKKINKNQINTHNFKLLKVFYGKHRVKLTGGKWRGGGGVGGIILSISCLVQYLNSGWERRWIQSNILLAKILLP
jgi:hypothetical protein